MSARPTTPRRRRGPRAVAALVAGVLTALALGLVAGCGDLRLETDPPAPLVPDDDESARQRAVADALALATLAEGTAGADGDDTADGEDADDPVRVALDAVATVARAHVDALGGLYVPTPTPSADDATAAAGSTATPAPTAASGLASAEPAEVLALLDETAASARADAVTVPDPDLARLLASVAASRTVLADRLARLTDAERPAVEPVAVPEEPVPGLGSSALATLVQSEDALGAAWEVVAARAEDDARSRAAARAAAHRERAEAWAAVGEIARTGLDPRRASYDLPDALTGAADVTEATAAARALEQELAAVHAAGVATVATEGRAPFVDALVDAAREGWRGGSPVLPGMPDVTG